MREEKKEKEMKEKETQKEKEIEIEDEKENQKENENEEEEEEEEEYYESEEEYEEKDIDKKEKEKNDKINTKIENEKIEKKEEEEEDEEKIKELFENELAPIKYNKNLGFKDGNACTVCTICIEDFKVDISKVSVTPCQHVFHFKCLNDWLMKNLLHPKCPNCNYNLLQEKKNDCLRNQGLNDIPEIPVVISRNSENRMINIQRYNDHNNSIDMENGLESNENRLIQRNENNRGIRNNKSSCISSINISSSGSINKSENKKDNLKKIDETRSNKENETVDEVVIENFDNNEEGN